MKSWLQWLFAGAPTTDARVYDPFISITSAFLGYGAQNWESVDADRREPRI
jgi:hypothetical protein